MSLQVEAIEQYAQAQKLGRKAYRESVHRGVYPYLQVLDEILDESMIAGQVDLGVIEIPLEKIIGTKTEGRKNAFASNFMPLMAEESEFANKWCRLCQSHLSDTGIRDPIRCYEYLGRFYVQEGNKRVSVLKSFGAVSIPGYVIRILPNYSDAEEIQRYYDFLEYYPLTRLYQVFFTVAASFPKLQVALGFDANHVWTDEERRRFLSYYFFFRQAFLKLGGESLHVTVADAMLVWLRVYPLEDIKKLPTQELLKSLQAVWTDVKVLSQEEPIEMSTESPEEEGEKKFFERLLTSVFPTHLNVAFVHELNAKVSNWTRAHEEGRHHLEQVMGSQITTQVFTDVGTGEDAEAAMETAVANGAQVIFATTAPLVAACRKAAAKYPDVKMLNCSISMPYTGMRTYYSRIYEGKFISGAIAGAISRNDRIGYIASYPIFGVPAGINAFALGVKLTNPRAKIELKWSCIPGDPLGELRALGVDVVSTLDIPIPGWEKGQWGTFQILPDGSTRPLASPYWNWGNFYVQLVRSILNGGWDTLNSSKDEEYAVNYWWGMSSGVIGVERAEGMPEGVETLAQILQRDISNGSIMPFHRHIISQDGTVQNDGSSYLSPEEILHMDWLCDSVNGSIPPYEVLTPKGKSIVRLQGIYRDEIPPEKEGVLL